MRQLLLTNWHIVRMLRLIAGIWIGVSAIQAHDALLGLLGTILVWHAVSNTGCCEYGSCDVPEVKGNTLQSKEINFEEVKTN